MQTLMVQESGTA